MMAGFVAVMRAAESARRRLTRGGHFALVWSTSRWDGDQEWQRVAQVAKR
jgi:hypothetical protein